MPFIIEMTINVYKSNHNCMKSGDIGYTVFVSPPNDIVIILQISKNELILTALIKTSGCSYVLCLLFTFPFVFIWFCMSSPWTALLVIKHNQWWEPLRISEDCWVDPTQVGLPRKSGIKSKWQEDKADSRDGAVGMGLLPGDTLVMQLMSRTDGWIWDFLPRLCCEVFIPQ